MAQYKTYWYTNPGTDWKKYIPEYTKYNITKPDEQYSDARSPYALQIKEAQNRLNSAEWSKPKAYNSAYNDRIDALIDDMANRKFSYDINGDALYNQYKNQYMTQGKQAMQDSMAQAALMTGGYGNSYGAAVGNQAYQSYLNQLNDKIPELYNLALSRYNTETTDKQNLYNMMSNQEAANYSKYRDTVSDYQADRSYYDAQLQNLRTMGQNLWGQNWSNYWNAAERNDTNWNNAIQAGLSAFDKNWSNYHWAAEQTQHNYEQAVSEDQWRAEQDEKIRQFDQDLQYKYWSGQLDADTSRYTADKSAESSRYSADKSAESSKYSADRSYAANTYKTNNSSSSSSSSGSSSSSKGYSNAYANFRNTIASKGDFAARRGYYSNYGSYESYVNAQINNWNSNHPNMKLTDSDKLRLALDYGIR